MSGFLIRWLVNVTALILVVMLVPAISVDSFGSAALAGLLLGLANTLIRPVLLVLTLPLNILSLGFFTLVINGFLFYLVSGLVEGFHIPGFFTALLGALLFSMASCLINFFIGRPARIATGPSAAAGTCGQRRRGQPRSRVIDIEGRTEK